MAGIERTNTLGETLGETLSIFQRYSEEEAKGNLGVRLGVPLGVIQRGSTPHEGGPTAKRGHNCAEVFPTRTALPRLNP